MASLLAGAADTGTDSYLYWMVNVDEQGWEYPYKVQVKGKTESDTQGSLLNLYYYDGALAKDVTSVGMDYLQAYENKPGFGFYAGFASNAAYTSYVFELLSTSGDLIDSYEAKAVTEYIAKNGLKSPTLTPLTMPMALSAPEPSSGLLLLLGVAGLALRRRKQITA